MGNYPSKYPATATAASSHSSSPSTSPVREASTTKSSVVRPWHDGARDAAYSAHSVAQLGDLLLAPLVGVSHRTSTSLSPIMAIPMPRCC